MSRKKIAELTKEWGLPKSKYFNVELIRRYFDYKTEDQKAYIIDDRQVVDLDLDAVFEYVDRTTSAIGQQYLYYQLRSLKSGTEEIERAERGIRFFGENQAERISVQKQLLRLRDGYDYDFPFLIFGDLPDKVKWHRWIPVIQWGMMIAIAGSFFYPGVFVIPAIGFFIISLFIHYWSKKRIRNFGQVFGRLGILHKTAKGLFEQKEIIEEEKIGVPASLAKTEKLLNKINFLKTDGILDSEIMAVIWMLMEILKIFTLSEISVFHKVVDDIEKCRKEIDRLFRFIGRVDMLIAIADLREGLPHYSTPKFSEQQKRLSFEGLYHPLIENCVANDLTLDKKSLLLTGSNMSGKTTFIRAINLNLVFAQTLYTSLTRSYQAPIFDIATSIRLTDNVLEGKSFYMEEVSSIGALIERSEDQEMQYLFTIDEVFKGTNTIERISAAKGILEYLNRHQHIVLVSTHDIELTTLLREGYDLYYFQEEIKNQNLSFDYKLKDGALKKRNAIKILEMAGYPNAVIQEAERLAKQFEKEKTGVT